MEGLLAVLNALPWFAWIAIFVIGGGKVYAQLLQHVDLLYLTNVDQEIDGDTFFPPYEHLIGTVFKRVNRQAHDGFTFDDYVRIA